MGQSNLSKPSASKRLQKFIALTLLVYGLYLVKSACGINITDRYSAPWWVKLPIASIMESRYGDHWHS
ncbi:MAG: hypothetical protein RLZZ511_881 [Cyanobacteriota bacterium]|jgi:hypothetical protein